MIQEDMFLSRPGGTVELNEPTILWTGELSGPLKLLLNASGLVAWLTGQLGNVSAMKQRLRNGYNGRFSDAVTHYDEVGQDYYANIAMALLEDFDLRNKEVLDVGCGTGILSAICLDRNPASLICADISEHMLEQCKTKINARGHARERIEFWETDAESLPFKDNSVDVVVSSMMLGMIPNQLKAIFEMKRVLRSGGMLAFSIHGPGHYREGIEALLTAITLRYYLNYRFEFWQRTEIEVQDMLVDAGLDDIRTKRLKWFDRFERSDETFDFFASTSSLWWYDKVPPELRERESARIRSSFKRKNVTQITSDVVFAYAKKR